MYITAGKFQRQKLNAPKGDWIRPTTTQLRQAVFNICRPHIEGALFLDICAGSGAVGFEALSQGAQSAVFIESDMRAKRCIEQNREKLKVEAQTHLYFGSALPMLDKLEKGNFCFDIIYIDPPYFNPKVEKMALSVQILQKVDLASFKKNSCLIFLEETAQHPLPKIALTQLQEVSCRQYGSSKLYQYQVAAVE